MRDGFTTSAFRKRFETGCGINKGEYFQKKVYPIKTTPFSFLTSHFSLLRSSSKVDLIGGDYVVLASIAIIFVWCIVSTVYASYLVLLVSPGRA